MTTKVDAEFKTEKISKEGSDRHEFIVKLAENVRQDDRDRQVWKHKQITASNQRLGVRRRTNDPYPGYNQIPVPTTDKIIKQKKSVFTSVATVPAKQIVVSLDSEEQDTPDNRALANDVEKSLNGLIRKKDFGWVKKVNLFVDYFLENGHSLFKVIEKFFSRVSHKVIDTNDFTDEQLSQLRKMNNSELATVLAKREDMDLEDEGDKEAIDDAIEQFRSGEEVIKFDRHDFFSEPTVIPVRGLNIIVPASSTEVKDLQRICHDMWVTFDFLKQKADNDIYDSKVVDNIAPDSGTSDARLTNVNWAVTEGLTNIQQGANSGMFNVRECQTLYLNPDTDKMEKWVFTWLESSGNTDSATQDSRSTSARKPIQVLQEVKLEYEHGFFTYVKHDVEYKNVRWYASRGIPEQIRGMHIITEKMFNARVIRDTYNNAPMFRVSKQLGWSGDELRIRPGQFLEAEAGEIEQINKQITTDVSSAQIETQAKAYIEEYQSIPDLARSSAVSPGEKTATEVDAITSVLALQANSEVSIFLETLSEVGQQMFFILRQSVTKPRMVGGVLLTPQHFIPKYNVSWVGSIDAANLRFQGAKMQEKIAQLTTNAASFGIVTAGNVYNMYRRWLQTDPDIEDPDEFITQPQEVETNQVEDQSNELVLMTQGFNAKVKPDDQHRTHIDVIEQWSNTPEGKEALKNPGVAKKVQEHANVHIQMEQDAQKGRK